MALKNGALAQGVRPEDLARNQIVEGGTLPDKAPCNHLPPWRGFSSRTRYITVWWQLGSPLPG